MEQSRRVIRLPGNKTLLSEKPQILNVCGYARVSTLAEEQEDSFNIQCAYYTNYIQSHANWSFVGIYADEGRTGTKVKARDGFQNMIEACREKKIDKIICKSVSRFARNTVEALQYIRELKELNISVFFETENIDTLSPNGEVLLSILASMAEQEARNISQNVKWGIQRKFAKGEILMPTKNFLGYTRDEKKNIVIDVKEAFIVKRIYKEFLMGFSTSNIAKRLQAEGIKSPGGKARWYSNTVLSILTNEKYTGNAIMGKTFKKDVLSPRRITNEDNDRYYIENSHPAIIDEQTFELVQAEFKKRNSLRSCTPTGEGRYSSKYCFSKMLICGECGCMLRRYAQYYGNKKTATWVCVNHKISKRQDCDLKPIKEKDIEDAFVTILAEIVEGKENFTNQIKNIITEEISENSSDEINSLDDEITRIQNDIVQLNRQYRNSEIIIDDYDKELSSYESRMLKIQNDKMAKVLAQGQIHLDKYRVEEICEITSKENLTRQFDSAIFKEMVEEVIIDSREFKFKLRNGYTINYLRIPQ